MTEGEIYMSRTVFSSAASTFLCLCTHYLAIKLNFNISKKAYGQQASRAKTRGLRGNQLNAARSSAAGTKILDRAVKSVIKLSYDSRSY